MKSIILKKKTNSNSIIFKTDQHDIAMKRLTHPISNPPYKIRHSNDCDKSGVKRIFSPFNKLTSTSAGTSRSKPIMSKSGLSPKEKCYIITSCQARASRYLFLKSLASQAIKEHKIFSIYGHNNAVRKALVERGWVEKIPPMRMNLSKIRGGKLTSTSAMQTELERLLLSNLVEKHEPNFVWRTKDEIHDYSIDMSKQYNSIVNKLRIDAMWTTKQGLCSTMKENYWFYIDNVAEVNTPRTYSSFDAGEVEDFMMDYKLTACTSLLKWILSMVANDRPIFVESGNISMNVIVFALNRCKEYLFRKQNKDIDKNGITTASNGQWNAFLKKYYRIIDKQDYFQTDREPKLLLYLGYAKFLLKEIYRYRPQLSCEGCHSIWIIKPGHCSRGRGIRMASKLAVITNLFTKAKNKYVVQKYIEEPLLIHDTKFDIRQYYLVTSTYPLVIWMYRDCYLKFSSQKYNLKNYHESIHLTNNAVQKKYRNCKGRHEDLPQQNMWDSDMYKQYLDRIGRENVWDNIIYPGMRKSIVAIMLACQDSLSVSKNRFELYGCDFILDKEYKPWLIEINSCPDLNATTQVTAKICPAVVSDIIKVVIDRANNPRASTGKFECIYRQPMSLPRYGTVTDLAIRGYALPYEYFYKGTIVIEDEMFKGANIEKPKDINSMLYKLKQLYDMDVMKVPEDEMDYYKSNKEGVCSRKSSDEELDVAATVITEQLDELLERITSEPSASFKSSHHQKISLSTCSKQSSEKNLIQGVRSFANFSTLLRKSCSILSFASTEGRLFRFSKLDDGSQGRCSLSTFSLLDKKMLKDLETAHNNLNKIVLDTLSSTNVMKYHKISSKSSAFLKKTTKKSADIIEQETKKIISFLHAKEKEYKQ